MNWAYFAQIKGWSLHVPTVSKRTGPTVFPLKSEPFIPSTGNFQGVIFHPCMAYHITTISEKLWKCEWVRFFLKWPVYISYFHSIISFSCMHRYNKKSMFSKPLFISFCSAGNFIPMRKPSAVTLRQEDMWWVGKQVETWYFKSRFYTRIIETNTRIW